MDRFVVYFDVETGGVLPQHPTIQLAAIAADAAGYEVGSFERKIAFDVAVCDPEALAINHFTPEAWKDAVTPQRCSFDFARWLQPFQSVEIISKRTGSPYAVAQLAGYNALTFDLPRLKTLFGAQFFPCSYQVLDVLQRVHFWFHENQQMERPANLKLTTIAAHFGIDITGAHDALTDVRLCSAVAAKIKELSQ